MIRFDRDGGFLIMLHGIPFQAMYRQLFPKPIGISDGVYWLLSVDGPMPADMAQFVYSTFAAEILAEFERTH